MDCDRYTTIAASAEGVFKEKGSKFLAFAFPVQTQEAVKILLNDFRNRYHDARHICFAYVLGADGAVFRSSDDGEPSGTAGRQILAQINSRNLTNVLVLVVRYFGGVLLGTGGLTAAYKTAAAQALAVAQTEQRWVETEMTVSFSYTLLGEVMRLIKAHEAQILTQRFDTDCEIRLSVRKKNVQNLQEALETIQGKVIL